MKFTLAIIPAFFTLSAFSSPIEPNTRQMPMCNFTQCLSTITAQLPVGIIPPCADAVDNLGHIQQAQVQGNTYSQADQLNLVSNTRKCITTSIAVGFAIPAACNSCLDAPPAGFK